MPITIKSWERQLRLHINETTLEFSISANFQVFNGYLKRLNPQGKLVYNMIWIDRVFAADPDHLSYELPFGNSVVDARVLSMFTTMGEFRRFAGTYIGHFRWSDQDRYMDLCPCFESLTSTCFVSFSDNVLLVHSKCPNNPCHLLW